MLDTVLFVVFPYVAVVLAVGGSLYRYFTNRFSYSSLSSEFLEKEWLFWGAVPWHYGIVPTLLIHLAGFVVPGVMIILHGTPTLLYLAELAGKVFALHGLCRDGRAHRAAAEPVADPGRHLAHGLGGAGAAAEPGVPGPVDRLLLPLGGGLVRLYRSRRGWRLWPPSIRSPSMSPPCPWCPSCTS